MELQKLATKYIGPITTLAMAGILGMGIVSYQFAQADPPKKIEICHHPDNANSTEDVDISVSFNALEAHLAHGDTLGACGEEPPCPPDTK